MQKTIIDASKPWRTSMISELWANRELLLMLAYRDIRAKYAQAFLGLAWVIILPLSNLLVLAIVFNKVAQIPTGTTPYPVFAIIGISAWTYFSEVFSSAGDSIIGAQNLVKKIYFPRLIIPLSKSVSPFIDLGMAMLLLVILFFIYPTDIEFKPLYFAAYLLLIILCGLTGGIWLSALTIRYRDFKYLVPFFLRLGFFITPIGYPLSAVPQEYKWIYHLNPLSGIMEGLRWSILGGQVPDSIFILSYLSIFFLFAAGILYFRRVETTMADIL